jgi:dCTP deaminase
MILSNEGIRKALASGDLVVDPAPQENQYTTSAVDLYLGDRFKIWDNSRLHIPGVSVQLNLADQHFDRTAAAYLTPAPVDGTGEYVLKPGSFVLGITRERIHLKRSALLAARVEGRSSFARLGLVVHLTAPIIHAGFDGNITLEMGPLLS